MKIKITINLGNYENVCIESSEHETTRECIDEIVGTRKLFCVKTVPAFFDRVFGRG